MPPERICVEVATTAVGAACVTVLDVPFGTTVRGAVERVRAAGSLTLPDWGAARYGIFGVECGLDTPLRCGDRVEVYEPLRDDPKVIRRRRAERQRQR
ncbi:MAG: RnfH family protein [Gammaproteobacteria bacterium]